MSKSIKLSKKTNKSEEITYKNFFNQSLQKGLVKSWQEAEIWAFFKGLNLKEKDLVETYENALKQY